MPLSWLPRTVRGGSANLLGPARNIATLVLAAAAAVGGVSCSGGGTPRPQADGTASSAPKVLVLGLDGLDRRVLDRLGAEGRLPHLTRLRAEGAEGVLEARDPMLSPILWTTIATGRQPLDHGIVGFLTVRDGRTEPVRSDERRVRAFWNVASERDVPVGVLGWYATWPAEPVRGFLVSDRLGAHQVSGVSESRTGLAYPADIEPELVALWHEVEAAIGPDAIRRFFDGGTAFDPVRDLPADRRETFLGILRTTEFHRRALPALVARFRPEVAAVYFEGTDAVGHLFAGAAPPPMPGIDPALAEAAAPAFDRFYEEIDAVVGEILAGVDPARTTVMVLSDHGFKTGSDRPRSEEVRTGPDQAPIWHRPDGVWILWGRGVRSGATFGPARQVDVVPTLLRLVDLPLSEELDGRIVEGALDPSVLGGEVRTVPSYESSGERALGAGADDGGAEVLDKLRALGYVGAGGPRSSAGAVVPEGQAGVPINRYNLGILLLNDGRVREALEVFDGALATWPEFAPAALGRGLSLLRLDRPAEAVSALEAARRNGAQYAAVHAALGEAYLATGRSREARAEFERALALDSTDVRASLRLAALLVQAREFDAAGSRFEAARRFATEGPIRADGCIGLAVLAEERGDLDEADRWYAEALENDPNSTRALERRANLALYRGRADEAVAACRRLAELDRGNARVLWMLGRSLAAAGRTDEARETLDRSLALDPDQPDARALRERL